MGGRAIWTLSAVCVALGAAGAGSACGQANPFGVHASAKMVECVWVQTPVSVREAAATATTMNGALGAIQARSPSNATLFALAKTCHVPGAEGDLAGKPAQERAGRSLALALAGKLMETWAEAQLIKTHQATTVDLSGAWSTVTPDTRNAIMDYWLKGAAGPLPPTGRAAIDAMIGELHLSSGAAAKPIAAYVVGRSILEALAASP